MNKSEIKASEVEVTVAPEAREKKTLEQLQDEASNNELMILAGHEGDRCFWTFKEEYDKLAHVYEQTPEEMIKSFYMGGLIVDPDYCPVLVAELNDEEFDEDELDEWDAVVFVMDGKRYIAFRIDCPWALDKIDF